MENHYLWEKQLKKFEEVYFADGIKEQFMRFLDEVSGHVGIIDRFSPIEARELYTDTNNMQYNLVGRSLFGIQRKLILEREKILDRWQFKNGCSINSGLIQSDHSGFRNSESMNNAFVEAKSNQELLDEVKHLLNLSNEEMARKFNIKCMPRDMATVLNAVILDPIVDYLIENGEFEGYSHCWNDSNLIALSSNGKKYAYKIERQPGAPENELCKHMLITLPNGESITFKQTFDDSKKEYEYSIDDISTEIIEIKGNSELLQKVVAQIERFAERELQEISNNDSTYQEPQKSDAHITENEPNVEQISDEAKGEEEIEDIVESEEEILEKQIIYKKLQYVLENSGEENAKSQMIDLEEFDTLVNDMSQQLYGLDSKNMGFSKSSVTERYPGWYTTIPVEQYMQILLPEDKMLSIEFYAREKCGKISVKKYGERTSQNRGDVEDIILTEPVCEQHILECLNDYSTDLSLKQLSGKKLAMKNSTLSKLEAEAVRDTAELKEFESKEGQNIGE